MPVPWCSAWTRRSSGVQDRASWLRGCRDAVRSVDRTFAWLRSAAFQARRLVKDYEGLPETSEIWIRIATIDRMRYRLGLA